MTKILVYLFLPFLFSADRDVATVHINVFHYRCSDFVITEVEACVDKSFKSRCSESIKTMVNGGTFESLCWVTDVSCHKHYVSGIC